MRDYDKDDQLARAARFNEGVVRYDDRRSGGGWIAVKEIAPDVIECPSFHTEAQAHAHLGLTGGSDIPRLPGRPPAVARRPALRPKRSRQRSRARS